MVRPLPGSPVAFVCIWFAFGLYLVCIWFAFGLYLVCIWFAFGLYVVCIWFAFGLYLVCIYYLYIYFLGLRIFRHNSLVFHDSRLKTVKLHSLVLPGPSLTLVPRKLQAPSKRAHLKARLGRLQASLILILPGVAECSIQVGV